ncbi:hypothetical protein G4G28_15620 [Massilia sp. Dwa41.01b]|uniref:hypothetical protein n=1 Tax=unclassified Massilia TaxID=2609279 RepID=UPI001603262E|nr:MULTISPECIES: hypothetical protein [unclassified Massilia]QNA89535.1 hypothetical protein G4G28_15620 [Massilia sp. Dwa41.01b]QNB00437.1 hypothetical protein G4G31_19210 [Massilia sp. Se16.2.3]
MLVTKIGLFDGKSWESLCQLVFKRKYESAGYHEIPASPGDFGLEGFTLQSGIGFQCYCPDHNYNPTELYEKQRDKITTDLAKLRTYSSEIAQRIGSLKIREWHFVTPEIDRHKLISHARTKELEVRSWNLPILDPAFTIYLRDADYYHTEINAIRSLNGEALNFDVGPRLLPSLSGPPGEYEANLRRKTEVRLAPKSAHPQFQRRLDSLFDQTQSAFLEHGAVLGRINSLAPAVYIKLMRIVSEYELAVTELTDTWSGPAEELVARVRDGLTHRITTQLSPQVDLTEAERVSRHIVARWLAVCELDFD